MGVGQTRAESPRSVIDFSVVRKFVAIDKIAAERTANCPIADVWIWIIGEPSSAMVFLIVGLF
jgi:hypothetical protein